MDKEQAIELLEHLAWDKDNEGNCYGEALQMAIEALKTQLSQEGATSDTISRQVAIDALVKAIREDPYYDSNEAINGLSVYDVRVILNDLASAQKKGHWIDEGTNYFCSECHRGCWLNSNYCPWCGADMRGERNE